MYFGADYYPEHWPKERWPIDAKMMRDAHMNVVRVAEFAWSKLEPEEGEYDFSWLDEAMEALAAEDIRIVLGTPTAAPPKWLMDRHPDFYPVDAYGLKKGFGARRHYCYTNPEYREYCVKIAGKMAEHYRDNQSVIAWQIDNEMGDTCYCECCRKGFQDWLEKKYGTIDAVNEAWGTVFWSQTYRSFAEIPQPRYTACDGFSQNGGGDNGQMPVPYSHNPGLLLDYCRFSSDSKTEFQDEQIQVIRQQGSLPITHNFMGHFGEIDYFRYGKNLDFISWDNYVNNMWGKSSYQSVSMAHDLTRGIKRKNFWVMEQQSGPCGWQKLGDTPVPGQLRLWTWQAVAHGAEAIVYFRWRACTFGIEQYWYGILDHDGIARRRYKEISQTGAEFERLCGHILNSSVSVETALVKSYDNLWSHRGQPHNVGFDYNRLLAGYYTAFADNHVNMDIICDESDFSSYRLVLMPAFNMVTHEMAAKCEEYVRNGGNLLLTFRSGTKEWTNKMTTNTLPGLFRELAGIEIEEFDSVNFGRTVQISGTFGEGEAAVWCDIIKPVQAEPLAHYASHYYMGVPAVTVNRYGKGLVFYAGCDLNQEALEAFISQIIDTLGIQKAYEYKVPGLEAVKKENADCKYLYLLNHNNYTVEVALNGKYRELTEDRMLEKEIRLEAYGVAVLLELQG